MYITMLLMPIIKIQYTIIEVFVNLAEQIKQFALGIMEPMQYLIEQNTVTVIQKKNILKEVWNIYTSNTFQKRLTYVVCNIV